MIERIGFVLPITGLVVEPFDLKNFNDQLFKKIVGMINVFFDYTNGQKNLFK
jgi:hypothetical protein